MSPTSRTPGLVSVVVPVYDGAEFIEASLASILAQDYEPLEVLVMDDASTDATPTVLASFDDRIRVVRHPTNRGQFANVNSGLERAHGEFVAVFHHDDLYDPGIVRQGVEALRRHPEALAVFSLDRFMDADGRVYGQLRLPPALEGGGVFEYGEVLEQLMLHRNRFLRTPGVIVRGGVYDRIGTFRTDLGSEADFEMWLRIVEAGPIVILDRHLFSYRHTPGSEGSRFQRARLEPERFFDLVAERLERPGAPGVSAAARRAFEAHRAEDRLLIAARAYALDRRGEFRAFLRDVELSALVGSPRVQRVRLAVLYAALRLLSVIPSLPAARRLLARRWLSPRPRP